MTGDHDEPNIPAVNVAVTTAARAAAKRADRSGGPALLPLQN